MRLPLLTKLDVNYDDGDIKLDVGCASITSINGDERFPGAAFIGIKLCDRSLNDGRPALKRAAEIMRQLEQLNAQIDNLHDFYIKANEPELQKIGGSVWRKSDQELFTLLTLEGAEAKFRKEAIGVNEEILSRKERSTLANVGIYIGKHTIFEIGISKSANFGGDNLTYEERRTMRYEVRMSFRLRNDIDPQSIERQSDFYNL